MDTATYINIKIDVKAVLKIFNHYLKYWEKPRFDMDIPYDAQRPILNKGDRKLFLSMYENALREGIFSQMDTDIESIVDKDVLNNCDVVSKEKLLRGDYEQLLKAYLNGETDISSLTFSMDNTYSFIESYDETQNKFLLRY